MPVDFDVLGRAFAQLLHEQEQHARTLSVLKQVVAGEIPASRVEVGPSGWKILPEKSDGPITIEELQRVTAEAESS